MKNEYAICVFCDHHYFNCILKVGLSQREAEAIVEEYHTLLDLFKKLPKFVSNTSSRYKTYLMQVEKYEDREDVKYFYDHISKPFQKKIGISDHKLRELFGDYWLAVVPVGE